METVVAELVSLVEQRSDVRSFGDLAADTRGTFHGLGVLSEEHGDARPPAQVSLHREIGVPIRVLAEPGHWYALHRQPVIAEVSDAKDRVLVRFIAHGLSGSFHGTCLYARRDGEWGCYTIRPNAGGERVEDEEEAAAARRPGDAGGDAPVDCGDVEASPRMRCQPLLDRGGAKDRRAQYRHRKGPPAPEGASSSASVRRRG